MSPPLPRTEKRAFPFFVYLSFVPRRSTSDLSLFKWPKTTKLPLSLNFLPFHIFAKRDFSQRGSQRSLQKSFFRALSQLRLVHLLWRVMSAAVFNHGAHKTPEEVSGPNVRNRHKQHPMLIVHFLLLVLPPLGRRETTANTTGPNKPTRNSPKLSLSSLCSANVPAAVWRKSIRAIHTRLFLEMMLESQEKPPRRERREGEGGTDSCLLSP